MIRNETTQWIRNEHKRIRGALEQARAVSRRDANWAEALIDDLISELEVHALVEQEIFYPALQSASDVAGQALVARSWSDHEAVDELTQRLRVGIEAANESVRLGNLEELVDAVEAHIDFEESEILKLSDEFLSAVSEEVAAKLAHRKAELLDSGRRTAQDPSGGEQSRRDQGREVA